MAPEPLVPWDQDTATWVSCTIVFWVGGPNPLVPGGKVSMPGMLVRQPWGCFPDLGALLLRGWRVVVLGEEQSPQLPWVELGTALGG